MEHDIEQRAMHHARRLVNELRSERSTLQQPYRKLDQEVLAEGRARVAEVLSAADQIVELLAKERGK